MQKRSEVIKSPYLEIIKMSEAKTVTLTIGERIQALNILNGFKGDLPTLKTILDDVKQFPITDEEWKQAELVKVPGENGNENWKWEDDKVNKEISMQPEVIAYIKGEIKRKSDAKEITALDGALITLDSKI